MKPGPRRYRSVLVVCITLGAGCSQPGAHDLEEVKQARTADSPECLQIPAAERRAILLALNQDQRPCADDEDCPCGSHCGSDAICRVDCLVGETHPVLQCAAGKTCSAEGRCIAAGGADDPTYRFDLALAPARISVDSAAAAVVREAEVTIEAKSLEVLTPQHQAPVRIGFVEQRSGGGGATVLPRVRCAAGAAFAASCELTGAWLFDLGPGTLRSRPRKIWVEVPRLDQNTDWTLEARSQWSDRPATLPVTTRPRGHAVGMTGRFAGTLAWDVPGFPPLVVPVHAYSTPQHIAIYEPTRVLFPAGHVVLAHQGGRALLNWLTSDVAANPQHLAGEVYFSSPIWVQTGGRLRGQLQLRPAYSFHGLSLDLEPSGALDAPACGAGCPGGSYCNADMRLCLPGSAPPPVTGSPVEPHLTSGHIEAWAPAVAGLLAQNPVQLGGADILGIERAYCYRSPQQVGPIGLGQVTLSPSLDLSCADGLPQETFGYANRTSADIEGKDTERFRLVDECLDDLRVAPSGPFTAQRLLSSKKCVSLGRVFTALLANVAFGRGEGSSASSQKLLFQVLRQWLAVHAYVARTAPQEREYDEVLAGVADGPRHERLGGVVDLVERGWRVMLDQRVYRQMNAFGAQAAASWPDHRFVHRPAVHWTFNQPLPGLVIDAENKPGQKKNLLVTGNFNYLGSTPNQLGSASDGVCRSETPIDLGYQGFSLLGFVQGVLNGRHTLFEKTGANDRFVIDTILVNGAKDIEVSDGRGKAVFRGIPLESGFFAYVSSNPFDHRLYKLRNGVLTVYHGTVEGPWGPTWGEPGTVRLGCGVPSGFWNFDEVSLWPRPLSREQVLAIAERYPVSSDGTHQALNVTIPPAAVQAGAGDEQAVGFGVHLLDAAVAHLDLLAPYVEAERALMEAECELGDSSPARDRVLARVGRGLRLAALMERQAHFLVNAPGAGRSPWASRYLGVRQQYVGKRAAVFASLQLANTCTNPLGITEDDLPLFHGNAVGASDKFFASSRFLGSKAADEIELARQELERARQAWQDQRRSAFQVTLTAAEENERLRRLEVEYEGTLRRLCGAPPAGQRLFVEFRERRMDASNCFIKRENPACTTNLTIRDMPSHCLRGQMGEQILAIQAAEIDARNADGSYDRAIDQYEAEMGYCARREAHFEEDERILAAHHINVQKIRHKRLLAMVQGVHLKDMAGMLIGGNPGGYWVDAFGNLLGAREKELDESEKKAQEAHRELMAQRSHELDLMACYHGADTLKFAIDAAHDVIKRAYHDTNAAAQRLDNLVDEVRATVDEGVGELLAERELDRVPPHHHYWLDDHLDAFRRHFRYARRLTYLAVRAFEYESQQSLGLRGRVLAASRPAELDAVAVEIGQRNAPMQGERGFVVGDSAVVLSLRDEILKLEDLSRSQTVPAGEPRPDGVQALRRYLKSDSAKVYSGGVYLGRGVRFSMKPEPWAETSCAERIWRVTTALQMENPLNNARMLLWHENAFASQQCQAEERGALHVARIRPHHNLLISDGDASFVRPARYTPMNLESLNNRDRAYLESLAEGRHAGFAGRGLYGNYVLLFPKEQFDHPSVLDRIKDVLFRFDIVEVTNVPDPGP